MVPIVCNVMDYWGICRTIEVSETQIPSLSLLLLKIPTVMAENNVIVL